MKRLWLVVVLMSLFSGNLYAETGYQEYEEKRTGFFAIDFINEFKPTEKFQYHNTSFDFKFGGELALQHTAVLGVRIRAEMPTMMLKYNYDFLESAEWMLGMLGMSVSLLFGVSDYNYSSANNKVADDRKRYITFGADISVYLRKFVSKHIAVVTRIGLGHELIPLEEEEETGKFSDKINLSVGTGVMWYLL